MKDYTKIYVKRNLQSKMFKYFTQVIYLVPILALILMFSSTQNIKYINQYDFLNKTKYESIDIITEGDGVKETIDVYIGDAVISKKIRDHYWFKRDCICQIFNFWNSNSNPEDTYFTSKNMQGVDIYNLKNGEAVISYDVSKKLKIKKGDKFCLNPEKENEDEDVELIEFVVKKVIKTKYAYGNIGRVGTIIINNQNIYENDEIYKDRQKYIFYDDESGSLKKKDELDECNFLNLSAQSVLVVNVVFPIMGYLLVLVLLNREIRRVIKNEKYNIAVSVSYGVKKKEIVNLVCIIEGLMCCIAIIGALLIYKIILIEKIVGQYVPFIVLILLGLMLLIIIYAIIRVNTKICVDRISNYDMLNSLRRME